MDDDSRPVSVGDWFVTILILAIPLVNIVMYFYWAFADGVNTNKRNFSRASLLWGAIIIGCVVLVLILGGMAAMLSRSGN